MKKHINGEKIEKPPVDVENFQLEWIKSRRNEMGRQISGTSEEENENSDVEKQSSTKVLSHVCDTCGKRFEIYDKLVIHMKRHDRSRWKECPICKKRFPDGLARHMNTHSKVKRYICDICGAGYTQAYSLSVHKEAQHAGVKQYFCDICKNEKSYRTRDALKRHLKWHVIERVSKKSDRTYVRISEKKLKCPQCDARFSSQCFLNLHTLSAHTAEKNFECFICNKKFAYKG